jgi:hypothetical protein
MPSSPSSQPLITLGLFSPFLGRLSRPRAFSAIILGLSIDFIIILHSRYLEERHGGTDISGALEKSLVTTGGDPYRSGHHHRRLLRFADLRFPGDSGWGSSPGGILVSLACAFFSSCPGGLEGNEKPGED